ncbi:MAG TPA: GvpL/GvpF family gas vesicle protein [Longimicrobiales bacterium]|nr:GvpL/GvpF family gas vesicle protein [Longimicrobiales bacterium]
MSEVFYLYGFVSADATLPERGLAGLADASVELVPLDGVAAVVSRLPAADYAPERLDERTRDLPWVAEQGLAHERVVAWFVDHAQILPVALFTLYSSRATLVEDAARRGPALRAALARMAGKREWDLKVAYAGDRLAEHLGEVSEAVAELDRRIAEATPGTRFLLQRKRDEVVEAETARTARRLAGELLDSVVADADRFVLVPVGASEGTLPVVLNAALLLTLEAESRVEERVRRRAVALEKLGLHVSFSGPWAPYRFLEETSADAG